MCFNKESSLITWVSNLITCYLLINYGDFKYRSINKKIAYFFLFVGTMQILEFMIWIDLNCKKGLNKIAGYLGPILNYLQPTVFFLIWGNFSNPIINKLQLIYFSYFLYYLYFYYTNMEKCSIVNNENHISWAWEGRYMNHSKENLRMCHIFMIITLVNLYLLKDSNYGILVYILSAILFILSYFYHKQNVGELWCFYVIFIPIIMLIIQNSIGMLRSRP